VKALVTGATGLLGRQLVRRLRDDGVEVRALVRPGRSEGLVVDDICEGDLREPETLDSAVQGVDWVFHAGAHVSTVGAWEEFEAANVRGTAELIERAAGAGAKAIVHVSSLSVYAVYRDGAVVTEDGPFEQSGRERGCYARSKLAADRVALEWIEKGAPVVVVRPGLLFGPGRRPPLARRVVALGPLRIIMARPGYLLPLAYVENVADALCLAAGKQEARGRVYTVVDGHVRQGEFTRLFQRVSGGRWKAVYVPVGLLLKIVTIAERLARLGRVRLPVSRHQVERTVSSATFSTARIEKELGWKPKVGLEEALRRAFKSQASEGVGPQNSGAADSTS
jgi:nucleoside-diphosphate-sugar epimerase